MTAQGPRRGDRSAPKLRRGPEQYGDEPMRRELDDENVSLDQVPLRRESSIALDSVMRLTGLPEHEAVDLAVRLYAAAASVAEDPQILTLGVVADPQLREPEQGRQRLLRWATGLQTTALHWLTVDVTRNGDED